MSERALSDSLRTSARWACCIAGLISVVSAFFVLFQPPSRSTVEWKEKGVFAKSSATSVDTSTPFTVLVVSGFALLIYGLNGYRIIRLSAAGITAEAASAAAKAEEFYGSTQQDVETLRIEQPGEVAPPPPTQPPATTIYDAGDDIAVYELKDVPFSVLRDALSSWPSLEKPPGDLRDFEFASRKRGKGNHPWTLKFRGHSPVLVSYGGHAKAGATVQGG